MPRKILFNVNNDLTNLRLDLAVIKYCEENNIQLTRSNLKSLEIPIIVNNKKEKYSYKVKINDLIEFEIPDPIKLDLKPQNIDFDIIYIDDDIAVINKPYGISVHPSKGHPDNTLVNGLLYKLKGKLSSIGGVERPGIVHRLDKDTSGLMIIALNDKSHNILTQQFKDRKINKFYHAIVKGIITNNGEINLPIGRSKKNRKKMCVHEDGKQAITIYKVLEILNDHTYIEAKILTGRSHQIRVHFSHIGHPIAGDPIYSRNFKQYKLKGLALCAKKLIFNHPITNKELYFEIPLPEEFKILLESLKIKK